MTSLADLDEKFSIQKNSTPQSFHLPDSPGQASVRKHRIPPVGLSGDQAEDQQHHQRPERERWLSMLGLVSAQFFHWTIGKSLLSEDTS